MESVADCLEEDGIWCRWSGADGAPAPVEARPALFLDRDGVIVEEVGYLHRPADVRLVPGAAEAIAALNRLGVPIVVLTNQSGIGRGLYGWPEFAATEARISAVLAEGGARLDMVLACPYHAAAKLPYRHPKHPCRKPRPGLLLRAAARLNLALGRSWIIGDRATDLAAGRAAGLAGGVHVLTGHGRRDRAAARQLAGNRFEVRLADSISGAINQLPALV